MSMCFVKQTVNVRGSPPSTGDQLAVISVRQSSDSTNFHPGASENVRLLLDSLKSAMRIHNSCIERYLTNPLSSTATSVASILAVFNEPELSTALQPSCPLVHAARSPGLKLSFDQVPLTPSFSLSFSNRWTSRISARQHSSERLSLSISRWSPGHFSDQRARIGGRHAATSSERKARSLVSAANI